MDNFKTFPNAPITEAILNIKAKLPDNINSNFFDEYHLKIKKNYPERRTKHSYLTEWKISKIKEDAPQVQREERKIKGYLFESKVEKKIVQIDYDGFTFNKLRPYESWNKFSAEAKELWELYAAIFQPINIEKISLRYINRIEVPLPIGDFADYLLTNPQIAPQLPQSVSNFLMRLEIPFDDAQAFAVITQTMQPSTPQNKLPLIFDIEVIKLIGQKIADQIIWNDFKELRDIKNQIFFYTITNKAQELFK